MTRTKRFLFDECLGHPLVSQVRDAVGTDAEMVHIVEYYKSGAKDANWIPALAAEGGWVVITTDGGKQSPRGHKLPELCVAHRITHVTLSPTLHNNGSTAKLAAIISFWSQIESLCEEPPGTRANLKYASRRGGMVRQVAWEVVPIEKLEAVAAARTAKRAGSHKKAPK